MTARRVGVLGLARSGRAAALLALAVGENVYASDVGDSPALREVADEVRAAGGDAEVGGHATERLVACDLIVQSPGIPPDAAVLEDERVRDRPRVSELEFAWRHLRAPVIAITGTNGKTTTTAAAAHLLERSGFDAPAAGNIGRALSEVALRDESPDWVVVEASSFQLAGVESFAPEIAMMTNLAPDHLDRYPSVRAYYADKKRIFERAVPGRSRWVVNVDDPEVMRLVATSSPKGETDLVTVAADRPLEPEHTGGFITENNVLALRLEAGAEPVPLIGTDELRLLGEHNRVNALFAALAAVRAGADPQAVRDGLRDFTPLRHRLEPVADRGGVQWINDSKATNPASARVALASMRRPTVLLLGGKHKGEPYTGLLPELSEHARCVVAYGEAAPRIEADLDGHIALERVDGPFECVVERAAERARPGDVVLLAPACASYDMFTDYEERGERFTELARAAGGTDAA